MKYNIAFFYKYISDPAQVAGSLFFIGIICISSYLSQTFHSVSFISFLLCTSSVLVISFVYQKTVRGFILLAICMLGMVFGIKIPLCLIAISTIYYFQFSKKSKCETILWETSCSLTALIVVVNIFGYWGMPFSIALIWFWSLPVICALILFYYFLYTQRYVVFSLLLICAVCTLLNQLGLICYDNECVGVVPDKKDTPFDGVSLCTLNNITNKGLLLPLEKVRKDISVNTAKKKWIISLVSTPSLGPEWLLANSLVGEYYIFAEHDNMASFIGDDSPFNPDSFHRKSPWNVYKPVMSPNLFDASKRDILYCSNIGCTLKNDLYCYPLVWSYTRLGVPILLAKGLFNKGRRFVYVGDSDSIVDFLAPYNPFYLRSLLGMPDYFEIPTSVLIFMLSVCTIRGSEKRQGTVMYVLIFLVLSFCIMDRLSYDIKPVVDVSIRSTGKWLSPHYSSNYSSMPKKLVQGNLTVAIEREKTTSMLNIEIISQGRHIIRNVDHSNSYERRFILLLPGSSVITSDGKIITTDDVPLGKKTIELEPEKFVVIKDARNLVVDGSLISKMCIVYDDTYIMASGSPQKIEGIHGLVHTK